MRRVGDRKTDRNVPKFRRELFAVLATLVLQAGCSGLDPQNPDPGPGPDPNSPCGKTPQVVNFFPGGEIVPLGTDTTLDMACWNIQTFPKAGQTTITRTTEIIRTLNLDVLAVEEISDSVDFKAMMDQLPEYGWRLSPDIYQQSCNPDFDLCYQKTGVMYKKSVASIVSVTIPSTFRSHSYDFAGRIPMDISLTTQSNGKTYNFHLIVVHLKAGVSNEDDSVRRRASSKAIHDYMDEQAVLNSGVDYIVVGDWNDYLNDPLSFNSFPSFLNDASDYVFLTMALVGRSEFASHPLGLIDQMLVNRNACADFSKGRISVLRLDQIVSGYTNVSDHRPVFVSTPVYK